MPSFVVVRLGAIKNDDDLAKTNHTKTGPNQAERQSTRRDCLGARRPLPHTTTPSDCIACKCFKQVEAFNLPFGRHQHTSTFDVDNNKRPDYWAPFFREHDYWARQVHTRVDRIDSISFRRESSQLKKRQIIKVLNNFLAPT